MIWFQSILRFLDHTGDNRNPGTAINPPDYIQTKPQGVFHVSD